MFYIHVNKNIWFLFSDGEQIEKGPQLSVNPAPRFKKD